MVCCKKCKYNSSKHCTFLHVAIRDIKYCPMMIKDELLNNAEKYMKENEPRVYMRYMLSELQIKPQEGDLLAVIDPTFLWHSDNSNPDCLKINEILEDGSWECIDPYYDYKTMAFAEWFCKMDGHTSLTPEDFEDAENDAWIIDPKSEDEDIIVFGKHVVPISYNPNIFEFIEQRKKDASLK